VKEKNAVLRVDLFPYDAEEVGGWKDRGTCRLGKVGTMGQKGTRCDTLLYEQKKLPGHTPTKKGGKYMDHKIETREREFHQTIRCWGQWTSPKGLSLCCGSHSGCPLLVTRKVSLPNLKMKMKVGQTDVLKKYGLYQS